MHGDANGRACGSEMVTGSHALCVGALPGLDGHIEMTRRISDLRDERQIRGEQKSGFLGFAEKVMGPGPVSPQCGVTSAFHQVSLIAHHPPPLQAGPAPHHPPT